SLTRPASSLIAGAFSLVCSFDSTGFGLVCAATVFVCTSTLCMFGYTANDVFDVRKDLAAGRPDKLIANGRVSALQGCMLMAALALASLTISSFLGTRMYLIMATSVLLVLGYSEFSRRLPKLKGLYTGALCCLPVIIGSSASGTAINWTLLTTVVLF